MELAGKSKRKFKKMNSTSKLTLIESFYLLKFHLKTPSLPDHLHVGTNVMTPLESDVRTRTMIVVSFGRMAPKHTLGIKGYKITCGYMVMGTF